MRRWRPTRKIVLRACLGLAVLFALAQLVPFGRSTSNAAVTRAARFPDTATSELFAGACGDCHSNLTSDIRAGREHLNVSEWDRRQASLDDVVEVVEGGEMPPIQYKLFHGDARLSDAQRRQLVDGLRRLYAADPPAFTR